jgi:Tfp pilus assembly protein PilW
MHIDRHRDEAGFTLIELTVVGAILIIVLVIVTSFLVSANNAVAASTARATDDTAARTALTLLEADIRFASNMSISTDGSTLYVVASQPACAVWTASGGLLTERTKPGSSSDTVALGVSTAGAAFSGNSAYQGLVTIRFTVRLPANTTRDKAGVLVVQTLSAENMTGPVTTSSTPVCTP